MIQVFGTPKCKATRAAQRFFADRRVDVAFHDLRQRALSKGELENVARGVGGLKALLDADGKRWKDTAGFAFPSDARLQELLLGDPLLLRTPIVRSGGKAVVGNDPAGWSALIG